MSEGKTDKDFDTLMDLLKDSPAGLAAISGVMVSHAELDIISKDQRLSDDLPLALEGIVNHFNLSAYRMNALLGIFERELESLEQTNDISTEGK